MYHFTVLYDDVLQRTLSVPSTTGKGTMTFAEINRWPLLLPPLVFPFRRALLFMGYHAYQKAAVSSRPHSCLMPVMDEEQWSAIRQQTGSDLGLLNFGVHEGSYGSDT